MDEENSEYANDRILLVEDDFVNVRVMKHLFEMGNYPTDWVKNGKESLDFYKINKNSISLMFMDLQMPVMNGFQAAIKLRATGFDRPIIAMTANAYSDDNIKSLEMGMDDFLLKPVSKYELFMMIQKWLQSDKNKIVIMNS